MRHAQYSSLRAYFGLALLLSSIGSAQNTPSITPTGPPSLTATGQNAGSSPTPPSSQTSVGGVRISNPTDVKTCGKLPISWVFQDPGLIIDDASFVTQIRVWVTNIGVDQSPLAINTPTSLSSTTPASSPSSSSPGLPSTTAPIDILNNPLFGSPTTSIPSSVPTILRRDVLGRQFTSLSQKRQQPSTQINITITESHPLLGYLNLTWSPVILPPNSFYQLWMESVDFNKSPSTGLAVRSSSDRFFVSASADQACLVEALTRSTSSSGSLNTSGPMSNDDSSSGIKGGAIAGIVIGVLVGVVGGALLLLYCMRKRKQRQALRTEKGIIGKGFEGNSSNFFGMTQIKAGKAEKGEWGTSTTKSSRRTRAHEFGSKDSTAPALKYHGRSASGDSGNGGGSTESTIAGTYEGFKPSYSKNASSSDLQHQYSMHGRKSSSVTSFGVVSPTIPGSVAGHSIAPSYALTDSKEGVFVDSRGGRRGSHDFMGRRRSTSRERSNKPVRAPSVQSNRSQSIGGGFGGAAQAIHQPPKSEAERTLSLPDGAAPPSIGRSGAMSPTVNAARSAATPTPIDPNRATSPTGKTIAKPVRKPAPAYPEDVVSHSTSPPLGPTPTRGFYPPSHGASNASLSSLANRSTGNLDTMATSTNVGRKMSTGSALPASTEFSGFVGAKDGPVHYLIPDMPPPGR